MKKIFLFQAILLLTIVGCHHSVPIEEQCPLPEFLIGSKQLRMNMPLEDVPERDSVRRVNLPGEFKFLRSFDSDGLYETVVYNEIKPTIGMYTQLTVYDGIIKGIYLSAHFYPNTDKECFQIHDFFTKRLSDYYHTTPKKGIVTSFDYDRTWCTDTIRMCSNHTCQVRLTITRNHTCNINLSFN